MFVCLASGVCVSKIMIPIRVHFGFTPCSWARWSLGSGSSGESVAPICTRSFSQYWSLGVHLHWDVEEISDLGAEFVGVRCIRILPRLLMVGDDLLPLSPLSLLFKDNRGPSWLPFHIPNTCGNEVSGCANDRFLLSDVISAVFDDMHTYSTTILRVQVIALLTSKNALTYIYNIYLNESNFIFSSI